MTPQHFNEVLFSVMMTTKTDKQEMARKLGISKVTLNKYIHQGVPASKQFLILDRLNRHFSRYLRESKREKASVS